MFFRATIELSIGSLHHRDEKLAEYADHLAGLSGAHGIIARGIYKQTREHRNAAEKLLNAEAAMHGYRYIGSGYTATAYLEQATNTVYKVDRDSLHMTPSQRHELAHSRTQAHNSIKSALGVGLVLPELVYVGEHPLDHHQSAVITEQPYCDPQPYKIFQATVPTVDPLQLAQVCSQYDGAHDVLSGFVTDSRRYYESEGLLPDTSSENLVLGSVRGVPGLYLLDSGPIADDTYGARTRVLEQLFSLEAALTDHNQR
jgi:hypothetical protein